MRSIDPNMVYDLSRRSFLKGLVGLASTGFLVSCADEEPRMGTGIPRMTDDLKNCRDWAVDFIWPSGLEYEIEKTDHHYGVNLSKGITSNVLFFPSNNGKEELMIYHNGHGGDDESTLRSKERILDEGYDMLLFDMPLIGRNKREDLIHHDELWKYSDEINPLSFFLTPVRALMDEMGNKYSKIHMMGLSGGGWTTHLISALDTRISRSYPVAGSLPLFLRGDRDKGDREQYWSDFYSKARYADLYYMAADSLGRRQIQILNQFDSCCFSGVVSEVYRELIFNKTDGRFDILIDSTHNQHQVSQWALDKIFDDLK